MPSKYRSIKDWKYAVNPTRNWSYEAPPEGFYCPSCNNLDPFQPPRDERGEARSLEPRPLGPALRRPIVQDFTGRRLFLNRQDFVSPQPTRWLYLDGRRLMFDVPYEDLFASARDGCPWCALLFDATEKFEQPGYVRKYLDTTTTKLLPGGETVNGIDANLPHDVAGLYVDIFRFDMTGHFATRVRTFSGIDLDFYVSEGGESPRLAFGPPSGIPINPFSPETVQTIQKWLAFCIDNHTKCRNRVGQAFPRRLLDVGSEIEPVQLVDATTQVPCIALSHCWGKKHLLRTTQETLDSMAREVLFQNLSPTFQHSVQLTRALGIRHLWIDSLCIFQDDPADWEAEAAKMAAIYTNAILVLSASAASNGDGGLFFARAQQEQQQVERIRGPSPTQWAIHVRRSINHSIQSPPRMRQRSLPLFDRAWAYQERLLATRILHFATGEMVWECKEAMACECRVLDRNNGFKSDFHSALAAYSATLDSPRLSAGEKLSGKKRKEFLQQLRSTQRKKVEDDAWHLIVTNYSKRLLTFDTDRLPALSGLAKAFSESASGGTYLAGLWSTSLLDDLTWCNTNRQESKFPSTYLAPSWSWVSVAGCVPQFYHRPDLVDATILQAQCTAAGHDPTGRVSSGVIDISGPVQTCTLFFQERDFFQKNKIKDPIQSKKRRFYVSLDPLRDRGTYEAPPQTNISNYKGVFSETPSIVRRLKVRTLRVCLDVSDETFLDSASPPYLNPYQQVFCLLIGRSKVIDWRETAFGGSWNVRDDEEFLYALVLKQSVKTPGSFERIGVLDPDPPLDNPELYKRNDGRHSMVHKSMEFFEGAQQKVMRIV